MQPHTTYRVVGVRADGSKRVLCDTIATKEKAEHLINEVCQLGVFASLVAEPDDMPLHDPPQVGQLHL
jgi:hypothetical protein